LEQQQSKDGAAKVIAFANGLRKNIAVAGRRWTQWPRGAADLAVVIARIDGIQERLKMPLTADEADAAMAACLSDLRAILEWTTYQSASLATARALIVARKTRAFAERFGLLEDPAARLSVLVDSEGSLIENVRLKNEYMEAIAERNSHLELPRPLVIVESLMPKIEPKTGKLALIQQLMKSAKRK
jgi:hypothetical protein